MSLLLELLAELVLQVLAEIVLEIIFGVGDVATHGRMRRVWLFAVAGAVTGFVSYFVRPQLTFPDAVTRYSAILGLAIAAGLVLAAIEARFQRGARGAATAGFLSGVGFSLAYAAVRRLMLL
jgi:hypothetical protein